MKEKHIEKPWRCGGCGTWVSIDESLCQTCAVQLLKGGTAWIDAVGTVEKQRQLPWTQPHPDRQESITTRINPIEAAEEYLICPVP